jgi:hypothetical protein
VDKPLVNDGVVLLQLVEEQSSGSLQICVNPINSYGIGFVGLTPNPGVTLKGGVPGIYLVLQSLELAMSTHQEKPDRVSTIH